MEYFVISAKFVPLKYYTLSSQLQRLTSFSVGCSGRRILLPGQIAVMRKWSIRNDKLVCRDKNSDMKSNINKYTNKQRKSSSVWWNISLALYPGIATLVKHTETRLNSIVGSHYREVKSSGI